MRIENRAGNTAEEKKGSYLVFLKKAKKFQILQFDLRPVLHIFY